MHLTRKKEATRPAGANILRQQGKFDAFVEGFRRERPHEALAMKCPAEIYTPSCRAYQGIPEPHYPFHDRTVNITSCGRICLYRKKINLSVSLAGQAVGVKEVDSGIWLVSFMDYDLEQSVTYVSGPYKRENGRRGRIRTCDHRLRRPVLYPTELRARPFIDCSAR